VIEEAENQNGENLVDSQKDAENGKGTGSTTFASLVTFDEDGVPVPIDELVAHELSHAEDADTGTRSDKPACSGCASEKETKAVQMQNQLRAGNPRTHFGEARVPNPTATPADPRKQKKPKTTRSKN